VAEDRLAGLGLALEDREHQLLLAHALRVLDFEACGHLDQLRNVQRFQFGQMHRLVLPAGKLAGTRTAGERERPGPQIDNNGSESAGREGPGKAGEESTWGIASRLASRASCRERRAARPHS